MPALRELQETFAAAVLRRQDAATVPGLEPADGRLERRLTVYRVNARENFAAALEAAFPLLRQQLGAEDFRSLAWSYQARHPSPSGNLFEVGRQLSAFLARVLPGTADEYLRDVARLEWTVQESMVSADSAERFDPRDLAAIPADEHEGLGFGVHPSVRLVEVDYPVFALWRDLHAAGPAPHSPAAAPRAPAPESILVCRSGQGIELHRLDALERACLGCLLRGESLGQMTEAALELCDAPDVGAILARWAARGLLTGLQAPRVGR